MSTKIYNGCEIVGHTLESFLAHAQKLHPAFVEIARAAARDYVMRSASFHFDEHFLGLADGDAPRSFIGEASMRLLDRQGEVERTGIRDPAVDFAVDVSLFPLPQSRTAPARLLAMGFIEHSQLRKCWTAQPFWRDFSYWDNTDELEGVTRREWAERKRLWLKVFPDGRPPSQRGYSLNLLRPADAFHPMDDAILHPHMPTLASRAHVMSDYFMKELPAEVCVALGERLAQATRAEKRTAIEAYLATRLPELNMDLLRRRATP